jgi:hypothetical protein
MTANEYRAALARFGLTQTGAARLFRADERTSRRWASGDRAVPPTVSGHAAAPRPGHISAQQL